MKIWVGILAAALVLAACKKSDAPASQGSGSAAPGSGSAAPAAPAATTFVAKMTELTDKLCACPNTDCAAKVNDELTQWTVDNASSTQLNPDDKPTIQALQTRYVECVTRLQAADPPKPPPKDEPAPVKTAGCEELHKKVSAYASCDKITGEQRTAMFGATRPVEDANDDAACKTQSATLATDAKKLLGCDIAAVGVKNSGPPTPKCAVLAKRLPGFAACKDLASGWAEILRHDASVALDPNDDKACAGVIKKFEEYVKERFPTCKF